jgi:hypothetical protein
VRAAADHPLDDATQPALAGIVETLEVETDPADGVDAGVEAGVREVVGARNLVETGDGAQPEIRIERLVKVPGTRRQGEIGPDRRCAGPGAAGHEDDSALVGHCFTSVRTY